MQTLDTPSIEPTYLPPIIVERVIAKQFTLVIEPPMVLDVYRDEEVPDFLRVNDQTYNVIAGADSREELEIEIADRLRVLWSEYSQSSPERLSPRAMQLRAHLLARMRADSANSCAR